MVKLSLVNASGHLLAASTFESDASMAVPDGSVAGGLRSVLN
jgi:hypothetical protein